MVKVDGGTHDVLVDSVEYRDAFMAIGLAWVLNVSGNTGEGAFLIIWV
jgi:hypothetical protein